MRLAAEELLELAAGCRRRHFVGAGRQHDQLRVAAIDQRQLGHLLLFDHGAERHGDGVDDRRVRRHRDGFLHRRRPKREIDDGLAADDQPDAAANHGLKSG